MTITYSADVATVGGLPSCFVKLLKKWRGSIYKIIYFDLIIFLAGYYSLNMLYRYGLNEQQKKTFHDVVAYFHRYNSVIPISFVLGFYVSIILKRWCRQFLSLPWPDPVAVYVSTHVRGQDERGRKMRRTVMRYVNLCQIMVFIMISPKVKKRFPTYDHLIEAGVLIENEKKILLAMDEFYPKRPKYWISICWAASILTRARKEGRIRDDYGLRAVIDSLNEFRDFCVTLIHYDTISIPLVYTQVVTLAVYSYFVAACIGQQWTTERNPNQYLNAIDYYFPVFTTLEFFFFMGWLKVAESLICPFGEDDDDFDVNYMIDRNLVVSYLIVDEMHNRHPQLIKDQYWDEIYPIELPGGTVAPPEHSTARMGAAPTNSQTDLGNEETRESQAHVLYRRATMSGSFRKLRRSDSSDETDKEEIWSIVSTSPPRTSAHTLLAEEEAAADDDELTFEKLKEEREREKMERQQQKVQRTVENAADLAAELPRRRHKLKTKEKTSRDDSATETDEEKEEKSGKD